MPNGRVFSSPDNLYLNDFKHPVIRERIYNNMKWLHESPRSIIEAKTSFLPCHTPRHIPCHNPCPTPCEIPFDECKQYNNYLYPYGRRRELHGYINNIHAYDRDSAVVDILQNNHSIYRHQDVNVHRNMGYPLIEPHPEACNRHDYKNLCYSKQKEYMTDGRFFKSPEITVLHSSEGRFISTKEGHVIGIPERTELLSQEGPVIGIPERTVLHSPEGPVIKTPERMYFQKSRDYYKSFPQKVTQRCLPKPQICCPPKKVVRDDCNERNECNERKCCNKYVKLFNYRR
jgi:hypothetical protein